MLSEVTSPDYSKARRVPVTYFHEYANVADNGNKAKAAVTNIFWIMFVLDDRVFRSRKG